jgi:hypothetical protein
MLVLGAIGSIGPPASGQTTPATDSKTAPPGSASKKVFSSRKPTGGVTTRPAGASPTTSGSPAAGGTSAPTVAPGASTLPADAPPASGPGKGAIGAMVDFLVAYALYIFAAIVIGLGVFAWFTFRGARAKEDAAEAPPPERQQPFRPASSATEEDEGPRRVLVTPGSSTAIKVADVEREYALVVNEADLKMPPLPEEAAPAHKKADVSAIRAMLAQENFEQAYQHYVEKLEADKKSEFAADVEQRLSQHFLRQGDLEKAGRVLEHHISTHHQDEIQPEAYFDLGYIHFQRKTLNKSKRYFRMFVERHKDPVQVDRAKKILARLDKVQNLN